MDSAWAKLLERLPLGRGRPWLGYAATAAICTTAFLVRLAATPILPAGYPYVSFFPAIILSSFLFGARAGCLAALLCGVAAWYCFIPPFYAVKVSPEITLALGFFSLVAAIDIVLVHWMQRANRRLALERERSRQLAQRSELLFRELQHRISNNLQVVSGLLTLQIRNISDEAARVALEEAARRLSLIGRIHRQLYDPHGEQLHLAAFLDQLGASLIDAGGKPGIRCRIEAPDTAEIDIAPTAAVPMALIIAEAVANAVEHGFAGRDEGTIVIRVAREAGGAMAIEVIDDGAALPQDFDLAGSDSLGLRLARMLARQLGGTFSLTGGHRTVARLHLPKIATIRPAP